MSRTSSAGRRGSRWRTLHANIKAQHQPCWLCGLAIRYDLDWPHPDSFSVDHVVPLSVNPDLAMDPGNLRAACLRCNQARQNHKPRPGLGTTSTPW